MPKIMPVIANDDGRSHLEAGRAARFDTPITAIVPHHDRANHAKVAWRPLDDGAVESVVNVPVFEPALDPENEGRFVLDEPPFGSGSWWNGSRIEEQRTAAVNNMSASQIGRFAL